MSGGIVGSTNLTAGGLLTNHEAYTGFLVSRATSQGRQWFSELIATEQLARNSDTLTDGLLTQYAKLREKSTAVKETREPLPTRYAPRSELDAPLLRALRTARCFWTQTLKIVQNLGQGRPGNQVDLKKGARVFFSSTVPLSATVNTPLGFVRTIAPNGVEEDHAMRYGDNGMDKINLPLPGGGNPASYDQSYLMWMRIEGNKFRLTVRKDGSAWRKASDVEGTRFDYSGGSREWGFFGAKG